MKHFELHPLRDRWRGSDFHGSDIGSHPISAAERPALRRRLPQLRRQATELFCRIGPVCGIPVPELPFAR